MIAQNTYFMEDWNEFVSTARAKYMDFSVLRDIVDFKTVLASIQKKTMADYLGAVMVHLIFKEQI